MIRDDSEEGKLRTLPSQMACMKALHFPTIWQYMTHTPGRGIRSSDQPCSSSLIFTYDPGAFGCLSWSHGQSACSNFQWTILLCLWPCLPFSLKEDWMLFLTAGPTQTPDSAASTYLLPASLLHFGFPRAADIVGSGMKSWPHPSLAVCPCPSYLASLSPEVPQYFTCKYNVYFIQSHLQTKLKVKFISATLLSHLNKGLFSAFSPCCAGLLMAF